MKEVFTLLQGMAAGALITYCLMTFFKWEGLKLKFRMPKD
jgi:hypothetical protein